MNIDYEYKLRNDIDNVMNRLDDLLIKDVLDIHDMADLQRYADTLKNLSEAKYLLYKADKLRK